jgi:hypothetical protein
MRGDAQLDQSQPTIEAVELDRLIIDLSHHRTSARLMPFLKNGWHQAVTG